MLSRILQIYPKTRRQSITALVLTVFVGLVAGCSSSSSKTSSIPTGPTIGHQGRWLTDQAGQVMLLHGVNLVMKSPPYYPSYFGFNASYAQWLSKNGLDLVRLGVLASGEMPTQGKLDQNYINQIVSTVNLLARYHIYTLLDWHQDDYGTYFQGDGMPNWMTITNGAPNKQYAFPLDYTFNPALQQAFQSFWSNEKVPGGSGLQDYYVEMLEAVAAKVAGNPWVLGYEVMNEPWPGTSYVQCTFGNGCPALEQSELEPFYTKATHAIRSVDKSHMIFLEPFVLYNFGGAPTHLQIPSGVSNVGLAFHQYALNPQNAQQVFTYAISWAKQTGGALLNTEWSNSTSITGQAGMTSIQVQENYENQNFMPFTYWVMNPCAIACSSNKFATMFYNLALPPTGTNINQSVDSSLVEPDPVAISGTPVSTYYLNGAFSFTWSVSKPNQLGTFQANAQSVFAIPQSVYPNGYKVSVTQGGRVVSPSNSSQLVIEQQPGAKSIGITVTSN